VRSHVRGDAARLRELSVAHGAAEGLLAAVGATVRGQVGSLRHRVDTKRLINGLPTACIGTQLGVRGRLHARIRVRIRI
jgi:hypothetical protein